MNHAQQSAGWSTILSDLAAGENLSRERAAWAMRQVMAGEASDAQLSSLLLALNAKGETSDEVSGFVDAMLEHAAPLEVSGPALDIVGTGGDASGSVNISTMSAVVAAAAGARVVKHGNRAATSRCGSADVLEALGVVVDLPPLAVAHCVDSVGIGFCFAPVFHPAMRYAAPVRRQLGVPTVFNILGPLANPARPAAALIGCANQRLAPVMAAVLASAGQRALVVRGDDGLDEVTVYSRTRVWDATAADGTVRDDGIDLDRLAVGQHPAGSLAGGDAAQNAAIARAVLSGEASGALGAVRDAVLVNTAAALAADASVRGEPSTDDITERVARQWDRAREAVDSGAALALLDRWVQASAQLKPDVTG